MGVGSGLEWVPIIGRRQGWQSGPYLLGDPSVAHQPVKNIKGETPTASVRQYITRWPAPISTNTESASEASDEITCRQALDCHLGSQDQRQSGGCILEGAQGGRKRSQYDFVQSHCVDRYRAKTRQPIIGHSPVYTGFLPKPT